jgi:hypothetical protein
MHEHGSCITFFADVSAFLAQALARPQPLVCVVSRLVWAANTLS